jgi:hypothetical protein
LTKLWMLLLETCNTDQNVNVRGAGHVPPLELKKGSLNSKSISTNTQYVTLHWNSWMRFISESSCKLLLLIDLVTKTWMWKIFWQGPVPSVGGDALSTHHFLLQQLNSSLHLVLLGKGKKLVLWLIVVSHHSGFNQGPTVVVPIYIG